ncbi:CocE/NonD hydrolase [Penicillium occitanis (nom. inval.)]|nr:CocE/NonD hydrolase [Penicillium occitanis (nom. inval.)]PCG90103.1 hypothetical protein PENOC_103710 [Penicillium occitanis (nom. inval.)]
MATSIGGIDIIFGDIRQAKALPLSHPKARWATRWHHNLYRHLPTCQRDEKCPALLAWSPYGKQGGRGNKVLDEFPFRIGVTLRKLSELQKWDSPDQGYWVQYGYVVVNVGSRGVGKTEGNIYQFGSQEDRDGADVVDWLGAQPWCSGKVSLSGNSYLAISQWFIAAENPKRLTAIAPEGISDLYRECLTFGGVLSKPALTFTLQLLQVNAAENSCENTVQMAIAYKKYGAYHDDKRAKVDVPTLLVIIFTQNMC